MARWDDANPLDQQADWDEHAAFMDRLYAEGFVLLAGPIEQANAALLIVRANSTEQVERRLADDPWGPDMLVTSEIVRWTLRLGSLG